MNQPRKALATFTESSQVERPNECPGPRVSIIMLTMNRHRYLSAAISSVRDQSFSNWELIVIHDGLDEKTTSTMAAWCARDSRIRYFHRTTPGNIANAMNFALARCTGDYVSVLDDDDTWIHNDKLQLQISLLEDNKSLVAVGGGAIVIDKEGIETMRYKKPSCPQQCVRRALLANPLIHSTVLFRKESALAIGGYDDTLPDYQDWDFCLKLMRRGEVTNLPYYFATYRVWDGSSSTQHTKTNAWSGLIIVNRHGWSFPGYVPALSVSICYLVYSLLPAWIRRGTFHSLSHFKKRFFSAPTDELSKS